MTRPSARLRNRSRAAIGQALKRTSATGVSETSRTMASKKTASVGPGAPQSSKSIAPSGSSPPRRIARAPLSMTIVGRPCAAGAWSSDASSQVSTTPYGCQTAAASAHAARAISRDR